MDVIINATCDEMPVRSLPLSTQGDYLVNTLVALGYDAAHPPLAELLCRYHQLNGHWLIASPIHWEATHNDAMIVAAGSELGLDDQLAKIWFAEVSQLLKEDGFDLVYHSPDFWLVNVGEKAIAPFPSLQAMRHQSMMPALQAMGESMFWQKLLTELQMFMGTHPLNSAKGRAMPVNGLWFWGGGALSENHTKPLISNDAILPTVFKECIPIDEQPPLSLESIVVIEAVQPALLEQLRQLSSKRKRTNWYWNNVAYQCQRQSWWSKLWKK